MEAVTKAELAARVRALEKAIAREKAGHARAKKALAEALGQQSATTDILRLLSASPTGLQPVLDAVAANAARLCDALDALVFLKEGNVLRLVSHHGEIPTSLEVQGIRDITPRTMQGRSVLEGKQIQVLDLQVEARQYPDGAALARRSGFRAALATPLMRDGSAVGTIAIRRAEARSFSESQMALVRAFADQAVIAIENAHLFNETKAALERQTATSQILRVIAESHTDAQPVFDTIVRSARPLCGGVYANAFRFDGEKVHLVATTIDDPETRKLLSATYPMPPQRTQLSGRAILEKRFVSMEDALADPEYDHRQARAGGWRRMVAVPMLREGEPIGAIVVAWMEAGPIPPVHEQLLKTFADQAVIAIENVRLFNETKEALERQTATAEILQAISNSPTDINPVLDAVAERAAKLCEATDAIIRRVDSGNLPLAAHFGPDPVTVETSPISRKSVMGRAVLECRTIHVHDIISPESQSEYADAPVLRHATGHRTMLAVPLVREDAATGVIIIRRREVRPFAEVQIRLLETFAQQAAIAIENVRLFKELQQRTEALTKTVRQLTALGEVGQAISSTLELETVLRTIVQHAVKLTWLDAGSIYEYDELTHQFALQASENIEAELVEAVRRTPVRKGEGAIGGCAVTLEPVQVADITDDSYHSRRKEILVRAGYRAILAVPLLREDHLLGALQVFRRTPGEFAREVVELLKTFATQSAMAIQNARLFREIAEKSRQLEVASRHKSDFLASMSHELRTPLNAILGFNEMILGEIYGPVPGDMREPLADIQTSGKHLLRLINNVLDLAKIEAGRMELALSDYAPGDLVESVRATLRPLAAEKGLEFLTAVAEDVPLAHGDAGRLTQCLMNLAGNALKFTRRGRVEIAVERKDGMLLYRVADTGMGIPADKIPSLFSEFRQTDATIASEYGGTGLGLSISRKFVEMHGGRIWVESEPGRGSTFVFTVPVRAGGVAA